MVGNDVALYSKRETRISSAKQAQFMSLSTGTIYGRLIECKISLQSSKRKYITAGTSLNK
jgi:hypothetical protein